MGALRSLWLFYIVDHGVKGESKWIEDIIYTLLILLIIFTFWFVEFKRAKKQKRSEEFDLDTPLATRSMQSHQQTIVIGFWIFLAFLVEWMARYGW